jgi:drug/metabolite transporter (DMT)-like permease
VGQKRLRPQVASLLMSFEAVFAALAGWLLLRQGLSARELVGCCLLLAAIIMVQTAPVKGPVKAAPKARRDA